MAEWRPLRDFVTLQRGQSYKGNLVGRPGPYLLGLGTIERNGGFRADLLRTYGGDAPPGIMLRPGDLYVSLKDVTHAADLLGAVARVPEFVESARLTQDTIRLDVDDRAIDRDFLYWQLRSPAYRAYCRTRGTGTTNLDLSRDDFLSFEILVLDRPGQRAIAEVLGALDDKIAANTGLANTAESLAVALSSSAPPSIALDRIATATRVMIDPASGDGAVVDLFSLPGFDAGQIPERVEPSSIKSGKLLIESPAVLVSKLNPRIPRIWEVPELSQVASVASTEFVVLNPKDTSTSTLWALLSQQSFSATLESMVAGTSGSHQRVKPDQIMSTLVGDPASLSDSERHRIDALCRCAYAARRENLTLASTRDALLPALMSGKISVRSAERLAGNLV